MTEYYTLQAEKLGSGSNLKIKIESDEGETNWLNINKVQFLKIIKILQGGK